LGGSAFYLSASLTLYLIKRWQMLEVKPKATPIKIPLTLKESAATAMPLETNRETAQTLVLPSPAAQPKSIPQPAPSSADLEVEALQPETVEIELVEPVNQGTTTPEPSILQAAHLEVDPVESPVPAHSAPMSPPLIEQAVSKADPASPDPASYTDESADADPAPVDSSDPDDSETHHLGTTPLTGVAAPLSSPSSPTALPDLSTLSAPIVESDPIPESSKSAESERE
jgi:hypothetical protein